MPRSFHFGLGFLLFFIPALALGEPASRPVAATVETTLATARGHIRQFAFDGDADSYFASEKDAGKADSFTLLFDTPVAVKSVAVTTGKPQGGDALDAGSLEVSADGQEFEPLAQFADGMARAKVDGKPVKAVRLHPAEDLKHPLAIREIVVESDPAVTVFKYPIEFKVDVSAAPEVKEWTEKAARVCERQYPMICEELKSDGFKPRHEITLRMTGYDGVAFASGNRIEGSARYFKSHPDDVGAMVHETVHCVQAYYRGRNPGWLVEGIADYIRFFKYEPGKLGRLNPERARYNGSYRVTAAFLAYLTAKYDKDIVCKLNQCMREGNYKEAIFKDLTGKTVQELGEEWKASLKR